MATLANNFGQDMNIRHINDSTRTYNFVKQPGKDN